VPIDGPGKASAESGTCCSVQLRPALFPCIHKPPRRRSSRLILRLRYGSKSPEPVFDYCLILNSTLIYTKPQSTRAHSDRLPPSPESWPNNFLDRTNYDHCRIADEHPFTTVCQTPTTATSRDPRKGPDKPPPNSRPPRSWQQSASPRRRQSFWPGRIFC